MSMIAVAEAFALGKKLRLDKHVLYDVAASASGQCWSQTTYCPVPGPEPASPGNNGYKPGFAAALMLGIFGSAGTPRRPRVRPPRLARTLRNSTRRLLILAQVAVFSGITNAIREGW